MPAGNTSASLSPTATTPTGAATNSNHTTPIAATASMPTSRSANATWDKPERARTSHACEPCRERKTKCDGSRPACRRCLHTGTTCYYGYGKGWRKRKTAEDLTATSHRLARYENLLNEIMPMVSSEVRALIDDAREPDHSNGSETNESEYAFAPPRLESSLSSGGPASRIILPLPVPSPHVPSVSRSSTSSGTYEHVGPPPALNHALSTLSTASSQQSQRMSPDNAIQLTRLPSITAGGILIGEESKDPVLPQAQALLDAGVIYAQERMGPLPASPTGRSSFAGWSNHELLPRRPSADSRKRHDEDAPVLPWLKTVETAAVSN
ncbi:hypothetical protein LTR10_017776 [Elasticomyces elasticus]|uniref:Zn(2)-C6 fungal-type domain-containing protein n=1 Tax=Exophiala sideris TaxID=1016849 RepID=A0ABR0JC58_9EURO|nr:hypothetical protein LTR10_017776 [Elasticomyces elasticus]KAK5031285.1 hypothetical protein LTS07_005020 [Exophiala sideris]KAK5039005.1 hypothetical protein LTR13_004036 [Exophiala sideris]KAK5060890.1 hypothetical protein LTR69_005489 [Exophiala sideris]KAK5183801.1 hypothetical protein LTR44_004083 [Eurotiomycetes sp. CCFEE 6388]